MMLNCRTPSSSWALNYTRPLGNLRFYDIRVPESFVKIVPLGGMKPEPFRHQGRNFMNSENTQKTNIKSLPECTVSSSQVSYMKRYVLVTVHRGLQA